ncbi:MAG: GNAT family N-acetyltransferase, partial [Ginsengibacter sp.]
MGHRRILVQSYFRIYGLRSSSATGIDARTIYIASEAGAVAGFIAGHLTRRYGCDGELQWINVAPEHRRSGTAS